MELSYQGKKTPAEILNYVPKSSFSDHFNGINTLIHGDNFDALSILLNQYGMKDKIDLIYIDPPFSTKTVYKIGTGRTSTVSGSESDDVAYSDNLTGEPFIEFLRERLVLAHELLSDKGSIYLHIDYKIGHYIKIIMDEIFGEKNFKNDITRIKCNPKNFKRKAYGNIKDLILFYSKSSNPIWNEPYVPYTNEDILRLYKKTDSRGKAYTTVPLHAPGETKNGSTAGEFKGIKPPKGRHWRTSPAELEELDRQGLIEWSENGIPRRKIFAQDQKGKRMQDIWDFKDYQYPVYPTEKNLELLKCIISTSSNADSTVLDFFCGSATTLVAAEMLGRNWIGIDSSDKALSVAKKRLEKLNDGFLHKSHFDVIHMKPVGENLSAI